MRYEVDSATLLKNNFFPFRKFSLSSREEEKTHELCLIKVEQILVLIHVTDWFFLHFSRNFLRCSAIDFCFFLVIFIVFFKTFFWLLFFYVCVLDHLIRIHVSVWIFPTIINWKTLYFILTTTRVWKSSFVWSPDSS